MPLLSSSLSLSSSTWRWWRLLLLLVTTTAANGNGYTSGDYNPTAVVYTSTNNALGNELVVIGQDDAGQLLEVGRYATGGLGVGAHPRGPLAPLRSQDSLLVTDNGDHVLVVNAGDDSVSVFEIDDIDVKLVDVVPSGGSYPNSIAQCGNYVYVLNGGGLDHGSAAVVVGFTLDDTSGKLTPLSDSTRQLNVDSMDVPSPAQVSFTNACDQLVVLVKDNGGEDAAYPLLSEGHPPLANVPDDDKEKERPGRVFVYSVDESGILSDNAVVSELGGAGRSGSSGGSSGYAAAAASFVLATINDARTFLYTTDVLEASASTHELLANNSLVRLQSPVFNGGEISPGWNVQFRHTYLYTSNTLPGSLSSFTIDPSNGFLTLLERTAVSSLSSLNNNVAGFADTAVLQDQARLYILQVGTGVVAAYEINVDTGRLTRVGELAGLPKGDVMMLPSTVGLPGGPAVGLAAKSLLLKNDLDNESKSNGAVARIATEQQQQQQQWGGGGMMMGMMFGGGMGMMQMGMFGGRMMMMMMGILEQPPPAVVPMMMMMGMTTNNDNDDVPPTLPKIDGMMMITRRR